MPKSTTSLSELLHEVRRIEEHREVLTNKKIRAIYKSLMDDLDAALAKGYKQYADGDGRLFLSYLNAQNKRAKFLEEIVANVNGISPQIKKEMLDLVERTYTESYKGFVEAVKKADAEGKLAQVTKDISVRPEVLKQAVNNNISKLTLPYVLEKHRNELIYQIQQELNIGLMNGDRYEKVARKISERCEVAMSKAENITRTETHRNIEAGFMDCAEVVQEGLDGSGMILASRWRTMKDEKVRPQQRRRTKKGWKTSLSTNGANHVKMEGVTVKAGEDFKLEPDVFARCPGCSGVARHDCRCRCFLEYILMTAEEFAKATGQPVEAPKKAPAQERVQLSMSDYPPEFTKGAEGKNTQKLIDYINGLENADPNAVRLYASMGKLENISSNGIPFKITHGKNHALDYRYSTANHNLVDVKLNYPKLTGDNFAGQVNTTLHEQMHLLDMYGRQDAAKFNKWFSTSKKSLVDTFASTSDDIGDDIAKLFKAHNAEHERIRDSLDKVYKKKIADVREKYLPNGMSPWEDMKAYRQYEKEANKLRKLMEAERDYESRNIMGGGICNLQDIYDALSGGTYRANGTVMYGHGQRYYARHDSRVHETIANYASLSVTRPDLIDMLRKDKPALCAELDDLIKELAEKAGA